MEPPKNVTEAARLVYEERPDLPVKEAIKVIKQEYGFDASLSLIKKAKAATKRDNTSKKAATNGHGLGGLIAQLQANLMGLEPQDIPHQELIALLPVVTESLSKKREHYRAQSESITTEVSGLRDLLPPGEEEEEAPVARRAGRPRVSNGSMLLDFVRRAFKAAGRGGLTKMELAKKVLSLGWKTTADTDEKFANSVYVSGINKLGDALERFKVPGQRESRYRLKK